MSRAGAASHGRLALRGLVAAVLAVSLSAAFVARGVGALDSGAEVHSTIPAAAGAVPLYTGVYHQGVRVGQVRGVAGEERAAGDDGTPPGTEVEILIDSPHAEHVPAGSVVRVVPRTLFGDVRLDLRTDPDAAPAGRVVDRRAVRSGDRLEPDTSDEAVLMYDVFARATELLDTLEPQQLQTTLTALAQALGGRGRQAGETIGQVDVATAEIEPATEELAAASGDLARLGEELAAASPDLVAVIADATRLSRLALDQPGSLQRVLVAGLAAGASADRAAAASVPQLVELVDGTGPLLDATAAEPDGMIRTLRALRPMGEAGSKAFATGRFAITAVPTFADPMAYTPADCPRYPGLDGATCGRVDGAAWPMVGPLVRSGEVQAR